MHKVPLYNFIKTAMSPIPQVLVGVALIVTSSVIKAQTQYDYDGGAIDVHAYESPKHPMAPVATYPMWDPADDVVAILGKCLQNAKFANKRKRTLGLELADIIMNRVHGGGNDDNHLNELRMRMSKSGKK